MRIELPDTQPFAAMLLQGIGRAGGAEVPRATILVKAAYDLVEADGLRVMVPVADPDRLDIVMADMGTTRTGPGIGDHDDDPDTPPEEMEMTFFDVTYEADVALEKARTDIVVAGHVDAAPPEGLVLVAGETWLRRDGAPIDSSDLAGNLFGWMPRLETGRAIVVVDDFKPDFEDGPVLPPAYDPAFNNFYRRSSGFSTPGSRNTTPLPPGAVVSVHQRLDQSDTPYRAMVPETALTARYRVYCGHGPDKPRNWRIGSIGTLNADTLILRPDANAAQILWRASWNWLAEDPAAYRSIQIVETG